MPSNVILLLFIASSSSFPNILQWCKSRYTKYDDDEKLKTNVLNINIYKN